MNRYPVWKYVVILIALLVGAIYTLPNFFGEAPAVQVSAGKATVKVDSTTRQRVEQALAAAGIKPEAITLDANSVKVCVDSTKFPAQGQGRDPKSPCSQTERPNEQWDAQTCFSGSPQGLSTLAKRRPMLPGPGTCAAASTFRLPS